MKGQNGERLELLPPMSANVLSRAQGKKAPTVLNRMNSFEIEVSECLSTVTRRVMCESPLWRVFYIEMDG